MLRLDWLAWDAIPLETQTRLSLVVVSHGTGSTATHLSWLAESLASHRYVVAGVTHHGNSVADNDLAPQGFFLWWERALDLTRVLDQLEANRGFGSRVDLGRVGAAGFSSGGLSVLLWGGARLDLSSFLEWCESDEADPSSCSPPPEALGRVGLEID